MAATILHFQLEAEIYLLAGLYGVAHAPPFFYLAAASVGVNGYGRIYQVKAIFQQPVDAILAGYFLVRGESYNDVPIRRESLLFEANQIRHQAGGFARDIDRPAAVKETVAFSEFERIESFRPVFFARFDDVQTLSGAVTQEPAAIIGPDGTAESAARFSQATGIAVDAAGNLWLGAVANILRFDGVPDRLEVHILDRPGQLFLGTGEAGQGPAAAAFANAVADALGARIRDMPLSPEKLQSAVRKT